MNVVTSTDFVKRIFAAFRATALADMRQTDISADDKEKLTRVVSESKELRNTTRLDLFYTKNGPMYFVWNPRWNALLTHFGVPAYVFIRYRTIGNPYGIVMREGVAPHFHEVRKQKVGKAVAWFASPMTLADLLVPSCMLSMRPFPGIEHAVGKMADVVFSTALGQVKETHPLYEELLTLADRPDLTYNIGRVECNGGYRNRLTIKEVTDAFHAHGRNVRIAVRTSRGPIDSSASIVCHGSDVSAAYQTRLNNDLEYNDRESRGGKVTRPKNDRFYFADELLEKLYLSDVSTFIEETLNPPEDEPGGEPGACSNELA